MKRVTHLILLSTCGAAGSWMGAAPEVAIRLFDAGQIPGCTLADAESVASNVLATAGVRVRWSVGPERGQPAAAETIDISGPQGNCQEAPGFGIGLAIAKRAIALHQGTIIARNLAERGLEVAISLPVPQASG